MYPSGGFIFVANKASSTISVFKLDIYGTPNKVGTFTTAKNPSAVKVDVQGKYLLVAHSAAPYEMAAYKINLTTGTLTYVRSMRTRPAATALAVSYGPQSLGFGSGYLYVGTANRTTRTGKVFGFAIGSRGVLTPISGSPWTHPTGVVSLAAHPTGRMLYAPGFEPAQFQGLIGQYSVNLSTGVLTNVGAYTQQPEVQSPNMVVESSGRFAYANSPMYDGVEQGFWGWALTSSLKLGSWLWYGADDYQRFVYLEPTGRFAYLGELVEKISPTTGAMLYWISEPHDFDYMAAYPSGRYFFAIATGANEVKSYTINGSTGKLTMVGSAVSTGYSPVAITVDPYGNFVFVANKNSNDVSEYKVNRGNGTLTLIRTFSCGTAPVGITTDITGRYLFVVNSVSLDVSAFEIDQATGRLTAVAGSPFHLAASGEATSILNIGKVQ
jgi:6-phosphogluconolactonase (cycloisomerase 2 family)